MPSSAIAPPPQAANQPIAHWTHTFALCLLLALTAVFGHSRGGTGALEAASHVIRYGTSMMFEWLLLGAVICEELIFRGYLLRQLTAWTRRPFLAVVLVSLFFGSVHLYEGLGAILPLAALALVYGLVVQRLGGDLRAVIVAHTLQDFLVAVFAVAALHLKQLAPH